MKKILCLDFDGVIHSYTSGWKGPRVIPDPPVPGAIAFLLEAIKHFDVVIHSSRCRYWFAKRAMRKWLWHHVCDYLEAPDDPQDAFHNCPAECPCCQLMKSIKFMASKPPAHVTIDDRAITFTGSWPRMKTLEGFEPWFKKRKEGTHDIHADQVRRPAL